MKNGFFNVLIIVENQSVGNQIKAHLNRHKAFKIMGIAESIGNTLEIINNEIPDIIFIDLEIGRRSGFKFVKKINELVPIPKVVFIAEYDHFALMAIKFSAFDYILKPIAEYEFDELVEKLITRSISSNQLFEIGDILNQNSKSKKIRFNQKRVTIFIDPEDIIYCKANGSYTEIFIDEKHSEIVTHNLKDVSKQLDQNFERLGRSLLFNKRYLSKIDRINHLILFEKNQRIFSISVSPRLVRLV